MDAKSLLTMAGAAVVGLGALAGAGAMTGPINEDREELQLSLADIEQALPPDAALTQAFLGTFRGLAVNILWQRTENLKNDGKFFEAMQLADWITTLQPRYPKVWDFTSWNNAYNISVKTYTPEERWQWVYQGGVDQLRDKGIFYNPNSPTLYRQLAWIFLHKIGEFQDDYNRFYKQQLALEWDNLLGGGPPPEALAGDTAGMEAYAAWLRPIIDAPDTLDELYQTEGTRRLVEHLRGRGYVISDDEIGPDLLSDFAHQDADFHPEDESIAHICFSEADPDSTAYLGLQFALWPEWAEDDVKQAVLSFARRKVITGSPYRMDPAKMLADAQDFGPLDWRHPAAHGIYWSRRGIEVGDERYGTGNAPDEVNTYRNMLMAVQQLQRSGRVQFEPQTRYTNLLQDLTYATTYMKVRDRFFDRLVAAGMTDEEAQQATERFYGDGFRNNMDEIISQLSLYGETEQAQELFNLMRERYANTEQQARYARPIEEFVQEHFTDNFENPSQARNAVYGLITQAIIDGYGEGKTARARRLLEQAQRGQAWYNEEFAGMTVGDEMPPMEDMVAGAAAEVLSTPPAALDPRMKVRLWQNLPEPIKQRIWPFVYPSLKAQADRFGYNLKTAFPAPAGQPDVPEPPTQPGTAEPEPQIERE